MQVSFEHKGPLDRVLSVVIPDYTAQHRRAVQKKITELQKTAELPGFRRGKAPYHIVEKKWGPQVHNDIFSDLLKTFLQQAMEQEMAKQPFQLASEPHVALDQTASSLTFSVDPKEPPLPLAFSATFEVMPDVEATLPAVTLEAPVITVEEADIDRMIARLRRDWAEWKTVDRPVQEGDRVRVDFTVSQAGTELDTYTDFSVDIGSQNMIPGFEAALVGHAANVPFTFDVTFPEPYPVRPELSGKQAQMAATIRAVQVAQLPELTESFLQEREIDPPTVDQLRSQVRTHLETLAQQHTARSLKDQLAEAIIAHCQFALPRSWVEREYQALLHNQDPHHHAPGEACHHEAALSDAEREKLQKQAVERVTHRIFWDHYAQHAQVVVDKETIFSHVYQSAMPHFSHVQEMVEWLGTEAGKRFQADIYAALRREKALEAAVEQLEKVSLSPVSFFEHPLLGKGF